MARVADIVEEQGVDCWYRDEIFEQLGVDPERYEKVTDILDVWFDSGVTHRCVLDERDDLERPAQMYLEGSDQHRGWFQSSLLTSAAMHGSAPYEQVLTHGFVVDAEGKKMSKSQGNVISPIKIMNTLGADVMRLWVAAADYRGEMTVSDEILKRASDSSRRIRNTARFLLGNLDGFTPDQALAPEDMLPLDRWAVREAMKCQDQIEAAYDSYQFLQVYRITRDFCAGAMGAFYLDIIKDRLYTTPRDSQARLSAQTALYHVLEALVRWIAPVLSFTAEEIWKLVPGEREDSVFMATAYEGFPVFEEAQHDDKFWELAADLANSTKEAIEPKRANKVVGGSLDAVVHVLPKAQPGDAEFDAVQNMLDEFGDELRFLLIVSGAEIHGGGEIEPPADRYETERWTIWVAPSGDQKCVRCWHKRPDVGSDPEHPEICGRCVENVIGEGETRRVA
jgi:isoleucyl-tRNA synthetase